jgi:UDP-N-acetylmuramyl pentapeptide phosphotransferase/UDP-N-acetylglucosamine-1-phosphate transferase
MFIIGLIDDVYGLRAHKKLVGQLAAAIVVCAFGIRIDDIGLTEHYTLSFGWLSWPVTILWIVGLTNAVNLIDGLDGLAAGISTVACGVITMLALYAGHTMMAVTMLALMGSLVGFLFFNFNPAKIFMGDCGSIFLGFILATTSVMCSMKSYAIVGLALPLLALGVPVLDMFFSILRRLTERRSIFSPDRGHIHHRLLDHGFKQRKAVLLIYVITLLAAGLGTMMTLTKGIGALVIFFGVLILLVTVFRSVGAVRFREAVSILRKNLHLSQTVRETRRSFEHAQLQMREARTIEEWWAAICSAGEKMDFVWLSLTQKSPGDLTNTFVWRNSNKELFQMPIVTMATPVHHFGSGTSVQVDVAVSVNGSLESAGQRMSLFGRLIDEHNVAGPWPAEDLQREKRTFWALVQGGSSISDGKQTVAAGNKR